MKVNLPRWDDLINLTTISNLLTKYPPEVVISWAGHKKGTITKGPELSMIGEAGAEAVIPLEGSNKKYGKTLMQHILPKYFPDMVGFRQQGGIIGGGSYDYSTANNENYTIAGPININSVANADDFLQQLKFKMRSSK